MRLGKLIEILEKRTQDKSVLIEIDGEAYRFRPDGFCLYRGHYNHLSIERVDCNEEGMISVAEFLKDTKECVGKTFSGYKGGDFIMDEHTPIWVSGYVCSENYKIIKIVENPVFVIIETFEDSYE